MKSLGLVRVEVQVRREYAALLRRVAHALSDPNLEAETSSLLRVKFPEEPAVDLKALLASAPLEGVDLTRPRDLGREVDL
jgi:hypothetical protein